MSAGCAGVQSFPPVPCSPLVLFIRTLARARRPATLLRSATVRRVARRLDRPRRKVSEQHEGDQTWVTVQTYTSPTTI